MTAEQFYWKDWHTLNPNVPGESMILRMCRFAEAYHRAEAAAQLAEKERERDKFDSSDNEKRYQQWLKERTRAEAAEQRLQEAQAQIVKIQAEADSTIKVYDERLRQREAELEHAVMCMDRSCKRCNAIMAERGERSTS